jgi:hypothetical protein
MILLAHHLELYHVPVLVVLFAAGAWIGWRLVSTAMKAAK